MLEKRKNNLKINLTMKYKNSLKYQKTLTKKFKEIKIN
jgi:hypothetical protein